MIKKRWETWVHYERAGEIIGSKLLRRNYFRWWAKACSQGLENDPKILASVLNTLGSDGYMTWPKIEIKRV